MPKKNRTLFISIIALIASFAVQNTVFAEGSVDTQAEETKKKGLSRFNPFRKKAENKNDQESKPKTPKFSWFKKTFIGEPIPGSSRSKSSRSQSPVVETSRVISPKKKKSRFTAVKPNSQVHKHTAKTNTPAVSEAKSRPFSQNHSPLIKKAQAKQVSFSQSSSTKRPLQAYIKNIREKHHLAKSAVSPTSSNVNLSQYIQNVRNKHGI